MMMMMMKHHKAACLTGTALAVIARQCDSITMMLNRRFKYASQQLWDKCVTVASYRPDIDPLALYAQERGIARELAAAETFAYRYGA